MWLKDLLENIKDGQTDFYVVVHRIYYISTLSTRLDFVDVFFCLYISGSSVPPSENNDVDSHKIEIEEKVKEIEKLVSTQYGYIC